MAWFTLDDKFRIVRLCMKKYEARLENPLNTHKEINEEDSLFHSRNQEREEWYRKDDPYDPDVVRITDDEVSFKTLEYSR